MTLHQDIRRYWNAVAGQSEYVDGYLLLGLKMLLKVCTDRRMFCKMTRWDPETAAAKVAAQRNLRLKRGAAVREKEQAEQLKTLSREVVKILPRWPRKWINPEKRKAFMREYYRQYRKTAKCQAYQKEYQRKRRARIKKEKKEKKG